MAPSYGDESEGSSRMRAVRANAKDAADVYESRTIERAKTGVMIFATRYARPKGKSIALELECRGFLSFSLGRSKTLVTRLHQAAEKRSLNCELRSENLEGRRNP